MTSREKVLSVYQGMKTERNLPGGWVALVYTRNPKGDEPLVRVLGRGDTEDAAIDDAASKLPPGSPAVNYLSGHDDPTLTETCPTCGASRKPGDKCASCGQQSSPAGETASEEEFIPAYGEPVSDRALLEMAHQYCQCPPEARASWSCEHCRAIAQLIFFRQSGAVPEPVPTEVAAEVEAKFDPAFLVLVPRTPTPQMFAAANTASRWSIPQIWAAMIAAWDAQNQEAIDLHDRLQPAAPEAAAARFVGYERSEVTQSGDKLTWTGPKVVAAPIAPAAKELIQELVRVMESVMPALPQHRRTAIRVAIARAEEYRKGAKK